MRNALHFENSMAPSMVRSGRSSRPLSIFGDDQPHRSPADCVYLERNIQRHHDFFPDVLFTPFRSAKTPPNLNKNRQLLAGSDCSETDVILYVIQIHYLSSPIPLHYLQHIKDLRMNRSNVNPLDKAI